MKNCRDMACHVSIGKDRVIINNKELWYADMARHVPTLLIFITINLH